MAETYGPKEYGVLYPTLRGGEPDRMMAYSNHEMNTLESAQEFMESDRWANEKLVLMSRQWEVVDDEDRQP